MQHHHRHTKAQRMSRAIRATAIASVAGFAMLLAVVTQSLARPDVPHASTAAHSVVTNCTQAGLAPALALGGTVTFNCGGVGAAASIVITAQQAITRDLTIDGAGKITFTTNLPILSNLLLPAYFQVSENRAFTLTQLAFTRGVTDGAYILVSWGALTLDDVRVTEVLSGRLILVDRDATGPVLIRNSVFCDNGTYSMQFTTATTFDHVTVCRSSDHYSGIAVRDTGSMTMTHVSVLSNTSEGQLFISDAPVFIDASTFAYNDSPPVFFQRENTMTLRNTSIISNAGYSTLLSDDSVVLVENSTFFGNKGAIYGRSGSISFTNSIVNHQDNSSGYCAGRIFSLGHNASNRATCAFGQTSDVTRTNLFMGEPVRVGDQVVVYPQPASPARERGTCEFASDQLGNARPGTGSALCDMGAVEQPYAAPPTLKRVMLPLLNK